MRKKFQYSTLFRLLLSFCFVFLSFNLSADERVLFNKLLLVQSLGLYFFWEINYRIYRSLLSVSSRQKQFKSLLILVGNSVLIYGLFLMVLYRLELMNEYFLFSLFFLFFAFFINAYHLLLLSAFDFNSLLKQELLMQQQILDGRYNSIKSKSILHFLQNSLQATKALIFNNPNKAILQLETLTSVLRALLQSRDKKYANLSDEISLVKEYVKLVELQSSAKVIFNTEDASEKNNFQIPPFVLPLVMDKMLSNSDSDLLFEISIYIENGIYLVVKMNIKDNHLFENQSEILMKNLKQRYHLAQELLDVSVIVTQSQYLVKVPLVTKNLNKN